MLWGRCFNCPSYSHKVATSRLPRRCLRCHGFRHLARDCKRLRRARHSVVWTSHFFGGASSATCIGGASCRSGGDKAIIKSVVDSSMVHPSAVIPAAVEHVMHSSVPWDSCVVDFFDPISSELRSESVQDR